MSNYLPYSTYLQISLHILIFGPFKSTYTHMSTNLPVNYPYLFVPIYLFKLPQTQEPVSVLFNLNCYPANLNISSWHSPEVYYD